MRTNIGCSFWACKSSHCHLHLVRRVSKAGRDWETTVVNKRKGRLQMCCDWRLFAWDTGGWLTRRGAPYVIGWGTYLTFSGWSRDGREGRGGWGLGRSWHTLTKTWSFWMTAAEAVVWLSRLVTAESSIVIYGLATVLLYIQSLRGKDMGSARGLHCRNGMGVGTYMLHPAPYPSLGSVVLPVRIRPTARGLCCKSWLSYCTH